MKLCDGCTDDQSPFVLKMMAEGWHQHNKKDSDIIGAWKDGDEPLYDESGELRPLEEREGRGKD